MRTIQIIVLLLFVSIQTKGQKQDYELIQDSLMTITCGPVDSSTLAQTIDRLEAFDTNTISKNIQLYYEDLGMCYYKHYGKTNDSEYLEKALTIFEKAVFHQSDYSVALWNLSFTYYFLNNCEKGKLSMDRYKKATPRKYWNREQMKRISKQCDK